MKKFLWRYSPFIVGGLIGYFLSNPPDFLRSMGFQGYMIIPVLFVLLLIFLPGYMFARSVYRRFELIPLDKQINRRDIHTLISELSSLGFIPAGPALDVSGYGAG
jgi:predicted PurR-regulated permease PerM